MRTPELYSPGLANWPRAVGGRGAHCTNYHKSCEPAGVWLMRVASVSIGLHSVRLHDLTASLIARDGAWTFAIDREQARGDRVNRPDGEAVRLIDIQVPDRATGILDQLPVEMSGRERAIGVMSLAKHLIWGDPVPARGLRCRQSRRVGLSCTIAAFSSAHQRRRCRTAVMLELSSHRHSHTPGS